MNPLTVVLAITQWINSGFGIAMFVLALILGGFYLMFTHRKEHITHAIMGAALVQSAAWAANTFFGA